MIPVSFHMPAAEALVMMVSCYAAGIYAGSFSAILLRAPGTSASAASAIEGYELTKRGQAVEAIRISTFASVVGGLISGFVLLLLAPPLARVALLFGPSEYFLIAILGLTAIASVSFGALVKGLISGMFGLFLATVGIDLYSGFPRFTFGVTSLSSGIGIMPAIIGLFAFAQALEVQQILHLRRAAAIRRCVFLLCAHESSCCPRTIPRCEYCCLPDDQTPRRAHRPDHQGSSRAPHRHSARRRQFAN
jgi:putative tricarboxylic transport membrane protein